MKLLFMLVNALVLAFMLTSCPSSIKIQDPKNQTVIAGGSAINFTAILQNLPGPATWSLVGFGSLSTTSGSDTTYTPPASVPTTSTATLTARVGNESDTATITINPAPLNPVPTITSFTATPSSLPVGGGDVTLSWATTGATTLSIDQGVGTVTGTSKVVNVTASKNFTLTATNATGSVTSSKTVTVGATPTAGKFDEGKFDEAIYGP
jgi:hypothetical protein